MGSGRASPIWASGGPLRLAELRHTQMPPGTPALRHSSEGASATCMRRVRWIHGDCRNRSGVRRSRGGGCTIPGQLRHATLGRELGGWQCGLLSAVNVWQDWWAPSLPQGHLCVHPCVRPSVRPSACTCAAPAETDVLQSLPASSWCDQGKEDLHLADSRRGLSRAPIRPQSRVICTGQGSSHCLTFCSTPPFTGRSAQACIPQVTQGGRASTGPRPPRNAPAKPCPALDLLMILNTPLGHC